MFLRRCLGLPSSPSSQPPEADDVALLANEPAAINNNAETGHGCTFWKGSEFTYNTIRVLACSTYGLTSQIMDVTNLKTEEAIVLGAFISCFFAAGEGVCHFMQSTKMGNPVNRQPEAGVPLPAVDPATAPLYFWQKFLIACHLGSDINTDVGAYLAIAQAVGHLSGLQIVSNALRYSSYVGLTLFCAWGNGQAVNNDVNSFRDRNALRAAH